MPPSLKNKAATKDCNVEAIFGKTWKADLTEWFNKDYGGILSGPTLLLQLQLNDVGEAMHVARRRDMARF